MIDRLGHSKEVEFSLDSTEQSTRVLKIDPINWNSDEKSYQIDKDSRGVLRKINTQLEFIEDGYDYLYGSTLVYGLDPEIEVIKSGKDTYRADERWREFYRACLDMPKCKFDEKRKIAKVPFTQGGLFDKIKAKYNDKFDLVTRRDANGNIITELKTIKEQVLGREIFRRSVFSVEDGKRLKHVVGDSDNAKAVPFIVDPNSDQDNFKSITPGAEFVPYNNGDFATGQVGSILISRTDRDRTYVFNGTVNATITDRDIGNMHLEEVRYTYDVNDGRFLYKSRNRLQSISTNIIGTTISHTFTNHVVTVPEGESYSLVLYSNTFDGIEYEYSNTEVVVTEDDTFMATEAKCMLPFEVIERLIEKVTGETGLVISNVLGRTDIGYDSNGEWALLGVSSGFWARGYDLAVTGIVTTSIETGEKQFSVSLKDAFEALNTVFPIMWTIQKVNGKEYVRVEPIQYTQQSFVGLQLARQINGETIFIEAGDPEREILTKDLFSGVKCGFETGGNDYEEVTGLTSPHGLTEYSTSYSRSENVYTKTSKIRADLEGYDLARRKQAQFFEEEDTPYDQFLFFRHLKFVGGQYTLRTWQDDFSETPKQANGTEFYSPDTMGNLLLTPLRCALRHAPIFTPALYKNPLGRFTWISSNCNSDLITTKTGDTSLNEKGSVTNSFLGMPFTSEYKLNFKGKVYQEMIDQFEGTTRINNEEVPNWYGMFEVKTPSGILYGKLIKSEITGEGKHEIALLP